MKKIAVLTSGGDASGMNASIRAVVRKAISEGVEVIGVKKGFSGLIAGDFIELTSRSVGGIIKSGGTILQTSRCDEFKCEEGKVKAAEKLDEHGIEGLVAIGGSGTFIGLKDFLKYGVKVVGVPATIDNDIGLTDYTIGFDTACNTVLNAINNIRDTASSHERTYVVEVMGRKSGHIALAAGLAGGAESILIPEFPIDLQSVCRKIVDGIARGKKHSIVIVAEGVISQIDAAHSQNTSAAQVVGDAIKARTNLDTRITVLGHIQRGGAPTQKDCIVATTLGVRATEELLSGNSGVMVGMYGEDIRVSGLKESCEARNPINSEYYLIANILSNL